MNLGFSPAVEGDAEQLVVLRIAAMRESLEAIGRFDAQRARDRFLAGFDPAVTRHILQGDQRVGFLALKQLADSLFLNHLYVLPAYQGMGIGSWALQQVFAEADALGLPVTVGALRESASNRFYLRHGFERTREEEFDIYYVRPCS